MRREFYVECFVHGLAGEVKLGELACDQTEEGRTGLARMLMGMYHPEDAGKAELRLRGATAEDAASVAQGLCGHVADAWRAVCRGLLQ